MKVLQVGLGNFGKRHLEAWHRLGFGSRLWVAEPDERKWAQTEQFQFPPARLVRSASEALAEVDVVDIVTPTDSHFTLASQALAAGKDVFIEKPMTISSEEARQLAELVQRQARVLQVGYYYRYHPASHWVKTHLAEGRLGRLRYISGRFMGFKRARTDVGVTHTDGIHFLDLFNWFFDSLPVEIYAVCRDHFGRGLEDLSVVVLTYPEGRIAHLECGYIQPGRWKDKVVPGALTTKDLTVVGESATIEIDYETEMLTRYDVHHELRDGVWAAIVGETIQPPLPPCDPVQMVCRELEAFLKSVQTRQPPAAGPIESGVNIAVIMEAIYESARRGSPVPVEAVSPTAART